MEILCRKNTEKLNKPILFKIDEINSQVSKLSDNLNKTVLKLNECCFRIHKYKNQTTTLEEIIRKLAEVV